MFIKNKLYHINLNPVRKKAKGKREKLQKFDYSRPSISFFRFGFAVNTVSIATSHVKEEIVKIFGSSEKTLICLSKWNNGSSKKKKKFYVNRLVLFLLFHSF